MAIHSLIRSSALAATLLCSASKAPGCGLAWSPNPTDALRSAALTDRLAVVVFTGSDWSIKSARLDQEILMNVEFTDLFTKHFALANADFPQRQSPPAELLAENTDLATRHKVTQWPTMLALRPDGTEFARIEYADESAAEMIRKIEDWQRAFRLESSKVWLKPSQTNPTP